jgi:hypothetical protein
MDANICAHATLTLHHMWHYFVSLCVPPPCSRVPRLGSHSRHFQHDTAYANIYSLSVCYLIRANTNTAHTPPRPKYPISIYPLPLRVQAELYISHVGRKGKWWHGVTGGANACHSTHVGLVAWHQRHTMGTATTRR